MTDAIPPALTDYATTAAGAGVGGTLFALVVRFVFRKFSEEATLSEQAGAQQTVLENLRAEVTRMGGLVNLLSEEIARLHEENIKLGQENSELKVEVARLSAELRTLQKFRDAECAECPKLVKA